MPVDEEMPPFAAQLALHMEARFAGLNDSPPEVRYALDPLRLAETAPVEEIAWAFRSSEILASKPGEGPGRTLPGRAPRLANCLAPPRFRSRRIEHLAVVSRLCDVLLAWGYELGIGREAEGLARVRPPDQVDDTLAWETVAALCQCPDDQLADQLDMSPELLADAHALAATNVRTGARHFGLGVRSGLPATSALLVNAGLLMRWAQQDDGPELHARIAPELLEVVRNRWPSALLAGTQG